MLPSVRLQTGLTPISRKPGSSISAATFDYLASSQEIRAAENRCPIGPPGTGNSQLPVTLGEPSTPATGRDDTAADRLPEPVLGIRRAIR